MKKILSTILATLMVGTLLVGCSEKKETEISLKDGTTLEQVVQKISDDNMMAMPAKADDQIAKDLFHLNLEDVEEYSIEFSQVMVSADNVALVKAKEGKVDAVKESLEKRLADMVNQFAQYLPDQKLKTENGKVIVKGDYVLLLIVEDVAASEETFNSYFN